MWMCGVEAAALVDCNVCLIELLGAMNRLFHLVIHWPFVFLPYKKHPPQSDVHLTLLTEEKEEEE